MTQAVIASLVSLGMLVMVLFGCAGTFAIAGFWAYCAIMAAVFAASLVLVDPDLARERMRPGGRPPGVWLLVVTAGWIAHLAMAGFDRGRLHWTDDVPVAVQWAAMVAFALSNAAFVWAMHVNRFFSSVPRIQSERGHRVITDGPYRWVRHPGYTAGLVLLASSGLALGSWLATLIGALGIAFLLRRTVVEDRMLQAELPGYAAYAARVRYRLLPNVW
jgi:protein-S-isoprenylcysteine O-methyltransferase Ste14